MMMANSRMAAKVGIQQARALVQADSIGDAIDRKVLRLWQQILAILRQKVPQPDTQARLAQLLREMAQRALNGIDDGLERLAKSVHAGAISDVIDTAPKAALSLALQRQNPGPPGLVEARLSPEQRAQVEAQLFDPLSTEETDRIVYAPSAGTSWNARIAAQTRLAPPDQLAAIVTQQMAAGSTIDQMARTMAPAVQGVRTSARRVARTEGMRVAHAARLAAFEDLGDMVVGYQIHATMDWRVRPAHAARGAAALRRGLALHAGHRVRRVRGAPVLGLRRGHGVFRPATARRPGRRGRARWSRRSCRFTFNLSLLNFHWAPNRFPR